jgi:putative protease
VVLARECSLKEIEKIAFGKNEEANSHSQSAEAALPLEVFVHGALCVAYSGQCLTSEALGGRSANRGECAQACRMPYELISDGRLVELVNRKYLLSPQDLAGLEVLPDLVRLGVASLKIEGRLKSAEYVANITRIYRKALDQLQYVTSDRQPSGPQSHREQYEMQMAFSRGLYTGWFRGVNNQKLVHGSFGKKRGVYLGEVLEVSSDAVRVELERPLQPGDGVVFDAGKPEEEEQGWRVYEIRELKTAPSHAGRANGNPNRRLVLLGFGQGDINFSRVHPGDKLWKTSDPKLERELRRSYEGDQPKFKSPVTIEVHGSAGQSLTLILRDAQGHVARCDSAMPLGQASLRPLTSEWLEVQLARLGGTSFRLESLKSFLAPDVILPVSELNRLRREAVQQLETQRARRSRWTLVDRKELGAGAASVGSSPTAPVNLIVLVRNLVQLDAALHQ